MVKWVAAMRPILLLRRVRERYFVPGVEFARFPCYSMTDDAGADARFVAQVMRQLEQALREVLAQSADHGQQIVIHVQPKAGGVRIQLPPIIREVRRQ